jgi:two-component system NtrC family sensor kinase
MKVARKIVWVMLATFIGVFALLGYLDARRVLNEYHTRSTNELVRMGRALGPALAEVEAVEGHTRTLEVLDRVGVAPTIQLRWRPLGELGGEHEPWLGEAQRAALARGEAVSVESDGASRLYTFVPVDATSAVMELSEDLTPRSRVVTGVIVRRLTLGGVAVVVASALAILLAFWMVGAPMRQLAHHARQIGAGDFSRRLVPNRRDEISELATEMNTMCERLERAQERIAAEADAKLKAQDLVRHADRMSTVGTLAAGMAHELGTPLGVIGGRARMISTAPGVSSEVAQYAQVISGQVERMTAIMRGLLGFARRAPAMKTNVNLRDLTRRILDLLAPFATKRDVVLELDPESEAVWASVDAAQVEQAVANIIVNAIQAMTARGEVRARVERVRATAPRESIAREFARVTVEDTGAGIRPEDLPRVFEPFFTTKPVGGGTGLGLSVTYGIVHEHGGFIDVKSELKVGTTVALHFPT